VLLLYGLDPTSRKTGYKSWNCYTGTNMARQLKLSHVQLNSINSIVCSRPVNI
jgi:hypothetical protein